MFADDDACSPINGKAEGGKTTSDADVAQRLAHEVSSVGILVVERGGRLGIVGQRIVGDIGVSPIRFVIIRGLIVGEEVLTHSFRLSHVFSL